MAAKATRFCFRTLRTKPWRVSDACWGGDGEALSLSSTAMLLATMVELQRDCGRVAGGRLCGRRNTRPRANNWLMDGRQTWSSQQATRREAWCSTVRRQRGRPAGRLLSRGAWAVVILLPPASPCAGGLAQMGYPGVQTRPMDPFVNRDKLHRPPGLRHTCGTVNVCRVASRICRVRPSSRTCCLSRDAPAAV